MTVPPIINSPLSLEDHVSVLHDQRHQGAERSPDAANQRALQCNPQAMCTKTRSKVGKAPQRAKHEWSSQMRGMEGMHMPPINSGMP